MAGAFSDVIVEKLRPFVGQNIDLVSDQVEKIAGDYGFWFRWLEPDTEISSERIPYRVNVHVTKKHKITRVTVG